ncbi:protein kinase C-binding protein 1-like isoform X2 [Haliotis rufescens]|uniref:protein kinase C-binding protein 1-like isoform X2 n=1 Tax=Haliotis rufescens TaxID=6454 RepID=UPI00201ED997|nr:protein kinase C-binding protein 1-like isoform X2 [Haliotis rufescens]XP_046350988.2 protein kinase C-binding protein 1-like isoform X2 [Haliotis rufescens]XP_046350989.2 protein kinase C-binding protein 1-like isoform X2 [Haliotis rufescens]XP_046350990.2 protein kinase C-binding protein 1-like isoform X2 [Haliotis rufescens]
MSGLRRERPVRTRDESSQRRRSVPTERMEKEKETESPSTSGSGQSNIRTRLSTGTLHMNGTQTFKDIKMVQGSDDSNDSQKMTSARAGVLTTDSPVSHGRKRVSTGSDISQLPPKKRKIGNNDGTGEGNRNDYFCWVCHKEGSFICCELCPRVFHKKCLDMVSDVPRDWVCPECEKILRAECTDSRSHAMAMITVETLCFLLKFALERMKHGGSDPFMKAVDPASVPHYSDYVFHPMDLGILEKSIKKKMYGCTEAFMADAKWILHNCIIFNGLHNKLTAAAKTIIKICRHEMSEIEVCPDCYLNSCVKRNDEWFCEPCREPHPLVWAKLKGYPFWPAKALREQDGLVDVRFFGAHDRSWVPPSQVFMLSEDIPTPMRNKRQAGFDNAMDETNTHIEKLRERFGNYEYAPFRTPYDKTRTYSPLQKKEAKVMFPKKVIKFPAITHTAKFPKTSHSFNVMKRKKIDPKSSVTKTASAVRLKYNSIITTRKAASLTVTTKGKSLSQTTDNSATSPDLPPFVDPVVIRKTYQNVYKTAEVVGRKDRLEEDSKGAEGSHDKSSIDTSIDTSIDQHRAQVEGSIDDSILGDGSSESEGENVVEDKVLDSSESEATSPVKEVSVEDSVDKPEAKPSEEEADEHGEELAGLHRKVDPMEETTQGQQSSTEVKQKLVEKKETEEDPKETVNDPSETEKDPEDTEKEPVQTDEECEQTLNNAEQFSKLRAALVDSNSKSGHVSSEGRQTPTDSADEDVVYTAKDGKVSECVRGSDSKTKMDVSKEKDKSKTSAQEKCSENVSFKDDSNKEAPVREPIPDDEFQPSLVMEVDSEDEDNVIDFNDSESESAPKTIVCTKSSSPKPTSVSPKANVQSTTVSFHGKVSADKAPGPVVVQSFLKHIAPKPSPLSSPLLIPAQALIKDNSLTISAKPSAKKPEPAKTGDASPNGGPGSFPVTGDTMKVALFSGGKKKKSEENSEKNIPDAEEIQDDEESPNSKHQTQELVKKYKDKLLNAIKSSLDDMCTDIVKNAIPESSTSNKHYQQELEKLRWIHLQEVAELKHNFKLTVMEMRACWDAEKQRLFKDISKLCEKEKNKAIAEIKKKQWCAQCGKEAIYYCCWNTSYCTYDCQQSHWPEHMPSCMQTLAASQEQDKAEPSKPPTNASSTGTKEDGNKKGSPPAKQTTEWSEKEEAIQAQRAFNLAPPSTAGASSTSTTSSPQTGAWRNRARDNLEQVLRRQEDPHPSHPSQPVQFMPPQLIPGQPTQSAGQPDNVSFLQGGQPMAIQYIQQVPNSGGPQGSQTVHLPPSSVPNFQPPPQVRLQGFHLPQSQAAVLQSGALVQNNPGVYPMLRQQHQPQLSSPTGSYLPRSQIFLAPNVQMQRAPSNIPGQMQPFQINMGRLSHQT